MMMLIDGNQDQISVYNFYKHDRLRDNIYNMFIKDSV